MEKKYPNEVVIIGIHTPKFDSEKDPQSIRKALERYERKHLVINDADRKLWTAYQVTSWPTMFLIDPEGKLVGRIADEKVFDAIDRALQPLVKTHRAKKTLNDKPLRLLKESPTDPTKSPLFFPGKVLADDLEDRLFIADSTHHRLVITDLKGKKLAVVGTGAPGRLDGPFDKATFNDPQGMALQGETLYVADRKNHLIRAVDLKSRTVKTIAGTGVQSLDRRRVGPPLKVGLNSPWALLVRERVLFIAMAGNHQIWVLDLARQQLAPFAGSGQEDIVDGGYASSCFAQPSGLATDGTSLFVADSEVSGIRAIALDGRGGVKTIVGTGLFKFGDEDGVGDQVRLQHALGIVYVDQKLYIADTYNHKIKIIEPAKRSCTTFVGGVGVFDEPAGLTCADGKLFVADTNAHRIRVVDLKTRDVSTLVLQGVEPPKP